MDHHLEEMLNVGFRFEASAEYLITYYLPRLIAGEQPQDTAECIHRADVYGEEPGDLAARFAPLHNNVNGGRFFFCACKRLKGSRSRWARGAGRGAWISQNRRAIKNDAGVKIGETMVLRFKNGGKYTDWLMEEHHRCQQEAVAGDEEPVICRIYVSPRAPQDSAARQESAAFRPRQEPPPPCPAPLVFAAPRHEPMIRPPPSMKRAPPPVAEPPRAKMMKDAVLVGPGSMAQQSCATAFKPPPPQPQCAPQQQVPTPVTETNPADEGDDYVEQFIKLLMDSLQQV
ncbi:hypothetical protein GUJ93_ZPchr0012g19829 [Zizania palustris]|uniref:NAC domain-containing protein n=1 Tax=Zizania palustris TaxID=103762 RepID=A0A8J5WP56_ZIZPA|nr:hypothetical protein GUJ93_ZPchr0012g19829 [Zizania palustris]